jgi:hypothetical protein
LDTNFPHVGNYTICVGAIKSIELFNDIQVREFLTIKYHIVAEMDLGDAIHGKADGLVSGQGEGRG